MGLRVLRSQLHSVLVTLWLTLSIASVVMAALTWNRLAHSVDDAVKMNGLNDALDRVFSLVLDAETGQRGFTITGLQEFLEPYEEARRRLPGELHVLAEMGGADHAIQPDLAELRLLLDRRMTQLGEVVRIRREQGFSAAAAMVSGRRGKRTMDEIRALVGRMRRERLDIFTSNGEQTRRQLNRANVTSLVAGLIGVGAGFFSLYLARVGLEHERRERELAEGKLRAEHHSEQKSAFLANVSHEIRTPMNAILGFTELLVSELKSSRQQRYLLSIRTAAESLLQLINDVLDMSKIEAGVIELNPEPTDPREICEFIQTVFVEQATRKGLTLTCRIGDEVPKVLLLDRTRLRQILVNLVGNAVKFTERGSIRLEVRAEPDREKPGSILLLIEVEDTGVGIARDRLDAIFKPFVQADSRRLQEKQGTGLGLAIVKRLTEMLGGSVVVASVPGEGTTFHLRIPRVELSTRESVPVEVADRAIVDFNRLRPSKLVVVDDQEMNRQLIADILAGSHHQLFLGADGTAAVELVRQHRPDLVLLDIRMPRMDGRQALAQIRAVPGCELLPVIAVTASSQKEDERELRLQFSGYLRKPFTQRKLYDELAAFLPEVAPAEPVVEPLPPSTTVGQTQDWAELSVELHGLESSEWPVVRDSGAFNEARSFAARIRNLGSQAQCPLLVSYSDTLLLAVEGYDAAALESELQRFPQIVSTIESRTVGLAAKPVTPA